MVADIAAAGGTASNACQHAISPTGDGVLADSLKPAGLPQAMRKPTA